MLQILRKKPDSTSPVWLPLRAFTGLKYMLHGWLLPQPRLPVEVLEGIAPQDDDFKRLTFTFAVIALSAQLATSDGPLTREEYVAFRDAFPLKGQLCNKIRSLFTLACRNQTPFDYYVTQIKYVFPNHMALFSSLVDRLFRIAVADGPLTQAEENMLSRMAHMLDIGTTEYARIRNRYARPQLAHEILGVSRKASPDKVKHRYHELMRNYHPDRFAHDEMSDEVEMLLKLKASQINEAYHTLAKRVA